MNEVKGENEKEKNEEKRDEKREKETGGKGVAELREIHDWETVAREEKSKTAKIRWR